MVANLRSSQQQMEDSQGKKPHSKIIPQYRLFTENVKFKGGLAAGTLSS
jgi:hypothetical protein